MIKIFVKQHNRAVTPFNSYCLENKDENFSKFFIGLSNNFADAEKKLKNILKQKFDATYNELLGETFVNEESVFCDGDTECVFDGMHFTIEPDYDEGESDEWEQLPNAMDSDINIVVSPDLSAISVDELILMNLDSIDLYPLLDSLVGRKVFWLDHCALRGEEHTSSWRTIRYFNEDMVIFDDDTEVYIKECFI